MGKKSRYKSFILRFAIILLCMVFIAIGASEAVSDKSASKIQQSLPPLPPGYEGDATPRAGLESEYVALDNLRLEANQIQLYTGWNMISIPLWLQEGYNTAGVVFADVDTGGRSVFCYNAETREWFSLYSASVLVPLEGIWIYSTEPELLTLNYASNQPIPSKSLYSGWNLVGIWNFYAHSAQQTLISVSDEWSQAMGYDAISQSYETSIINGGSGTHSDSIPMFPTKSYWLFVTTNGLLVPFNGGPLAHNFDSTEFTPTAYNAKVDQSTMGYSSDSSTNAHASEAYGRLKYDAVFFVNGHGIEYDGSHKGGGIEFSSDSWIFVTDTETPEGCQAYYLISDYIQELQDAKLIVYLACYSAHYNPYNGDLLYSTVWEKGADAGIGFDGSIETNNGKCWSDNFWERTKNGENIYTAAMNAKEDCYWAFPYGYWGIDTIEVSGNYVYDYLTPADYGDY